MSETMQAHFTEHLRVVEEARAQIPKLVEIADRLTARLKARGRIFLLGNGGSAADAQHIAAELVGRFQTDRQALPAAAFTTDTSILTAVGNDLGFERVFERQVEAWVTAKDAVWALSVSGTSPNVVRAMELARRLNALTIGFTGRRGQSLCELTDLSFVVDSERADRVQEVHQLAYHMICERVELQFTT
jgi:D-sedoheptulose 7-phosphate isomerase